MENCVYLKKQKADILFWLWSRIVSNFWKTNCHAVYTHYPCPSSSTLIILWALKLTQTTNFIPINCSDCFNLPFFHHSHCYWNYYQTCPCSNSNKDKEIPHLTYSNKGNAESYPQFNRFFIRRDLPLETVQTILPLKGKESVRFTLPSVLFARQWANLDDPNSACRVPMVMDPWFSVLVLGRTRSESTNWTMLGGLDSTKQTHTTIFSSEEQEKFLILGATVKTRNVQKLIYISNLLLQYIYKLFMTNWTTLSCITNSTQDTCVFVYHQIVPASVLLLSKCTSKCFWRGVVCLPLYQSNVKAKLVPLLLNTPMNESLDVNYQRT